MSYYHSEAAHESSSYYINSADSFYINDSRALQKEIRDVNYYITSIRRRLDDYDDGDISDVRSMIDKAVVLTSSAQRDITQFKEYVSNAPTPQDAMNRQQMLNKFTTSISNMAEELEDIVKKYASMKKEISAVSRQQYNKRQQDKQHTCGSSTSSSSTATSRSSYHPTLSQKNTGEDTRIATKKSEMHNISGDHHHKLRITPSTSTTAALLPNLMTTQRQEVEMNIDGDIEDGLCRDKLNDIRRIGADMGELQDIYTTLNNDILKQDDKIDSIHDAMLRTLDTTQKANIELQQATDRRDTSLKRKAYAFTALAATAGLYILISSI